MGIYEPGPYDNVGVGTLLFTLVEPHRGHEVDYNRWYERDHFYAGCLIGRSWFAGARFVATAADKALRFPDPSPFLPDVSAGSYLAVYWIEAGRDAEAIAWGSEQVHHLHETGRMFEARDHVHTLMYVHRWSYQRDDDGVPPALALDHGFAGLVTVMVERPADTDARSFSHWVRDEAVGPVVAGSPVELVVAATPIPLPEGAPVFQPDNPGHDRRMLLLCFCDAAPEPAMATVEELTGVLADGVGSVAYAAPFRPTVPGTDTYTDQLW